MTTLKVKEILMKSKWHKNLVEFCEVFHPIVPTDRLFGHQGMQAVKNITQCILDLVYSVRILCGV